MAKIVLDNTAFYTPLQKRILVDCDSRFIFWKAGRRSGKTTGARRWLLDRGYDSGRINLPCFWVSPTIEMARKVFDLFVKEYKPVIKDFNISRRQIILRNGRELFFLGCDRPETIEGSGLWACVMDEARHVKTDQVWHESISPMLSDAAEDGGGMALVISTPKSRLHWFSQIIKKIQDGNYEEDCSAFVTSTAEAGTVSLAEIERSRARLPKDIFERNFLAKDVALEGLIYREFDPDRHWLPEEEIVKKFAPYAYYCGLDYGSSEGHPTVFTVIAQDAGGRLQAVMDERYIVGANQFDVEATAAELKEKYPIQCFYTDHNRPDFKTALQQAGHRAQLAKKGPDSVMFGIQVVRKLLFFNDERPPRLYFNRDKVKKLIAEIEDYQYKPGTELPDKAAGHDDGCDSMRYCLTMINQQAKKGTIRAY